MYAVVNPATGEKLEEYPEISDDELDAAIARAWEAREALTSLSAAERAEKIKRLGELHLERRETLAAIAVKEMGKPMEQALGEVDFCGDIYGYYADRAADFLKDEPIELLAGEGTAVIRRSAMGPLLGIMPWNFPYYQVARFAGPNLIVGNPILLKPAPQCPESAEAIQKMYDDVGLPEGAYQTILATHEQIAEKVIPDPRVRGVSVTGSERAGAAVAEVAGRNLKKVVLEMGGSDPFIVLATQNLDEVVDAAVEARLDNTGQSCNAAKRFIVVDELYDDFLAKFTEKMKEVEPGIRPRTRRWGHSRRRPRRSAFRTRSTARRPRAPRPFSTATGRTTSSARRSSPVSAPRATPTGRSSSGPSRAFTGSRPRRRRSGSPTTRRSASAPTSSRPTPSRATASPTTSRPAWSS